MPGKFLNENFKCKEATDNAISGFFYANPTFDYLAFTVVKFEFGELFQQDCIAQKKEQLQLGYFLLEI